MVFKLLKHSCIFILFLIFSCQSRSSKYYKNSITENSESIIKESLSKIDSRKETFSLVTWNIQDLGRSKNGEEIISIAKIIKDYDIIAIQEIVGKDPAGIQAVAKIVDELNRFGTKWDYRVSNPTKSPSSNMSERYGFLWKTSKVLLKGIPKLDDKLEDLCYREPFIGEFKLKGRSNTIRVVNYHARKHNDKPEQEIIHLKDYQERFRSSNLIICGDFNLNEKHAVWDGFYKKGFINALSNTPTTLKIRCKSGSYLNHSIDNIFYTNSTKVIESGNIDFVKYCKNLSDARKLSDHLPAYIKFQ